MVEATKLPVETGVDPFKLAEQMFGSGIKIVDATYQGDPQSAGIYSGADKYAPGVAPSDRGVILSTGHARDFSNEKGQANQHDGTSSDTKGADGDARLNEIAGTKTYDAAIFEAKFVPMGETLTMQVTMPVGSRRSVAPSCDEMRAPPTP